MGSKAYWSEARAELIAMSMEFDTPTHWATFTCNETGWSDLKAACGGEHHSQRPVEATRQYNHRTATSTADDDDEDEDDERASNSGASSASEASSDDDDDNAANGLVDGVPNSTPLKFALGAIEQYENRPLSSVDNPEKQGSRRDICSVK